MIFIAFHFYYFYHTNFFRTSFSSFTFSYFFFIVVNFLDFFSLFYLEVKSNSNVKVKIEPDFLQRYISRAKITPSI